MATGLESLYDTAGQAVAVPGVDAASAVQAGGRIAVVGPDGWRGTVPVASLQQALNMGYKPELPGQHEERRLEQTYGAAPIRSGLEGAARGASFGLSDLLLGAYDPEGVRERKDRNAIAAGVGEAAGFIGSAALTGGGGLAGKVGGAAAEKVAASGAVRALAGGGTLARAAAKVAPAAVREGVAGGMFGLGQGVSDVALSKDPMGAEAVIATLGSHAAIGLGLGAGVGVAGEALGAAVGSAGRAAKKLGAEVASRLESEAGGSAAVIAKDPVIASGVYDKAGLEALRKSEVDALAAQRAVGGKQIAEEVRQFREEYREFGGRLVGQLPKGMGLGREVIQTERALQTVVGDLKSLADDPTRALGALRRQEQKLTELAEKVPSETMQAVLKKNAELQEKIISFGGAGQTSDRLAAIDAKLADMARPLPAAGFVRKGIGLALGGLIGSAIPGGTFIGSMVGRELAESATGAVMKKLTGAFAEKANAITDGIKAMLSKAPGPSSAMNALEPLAAAAKEKGGSVWARAATVVSNAAANMDVTRNQIHESLTGIRAADPQLADQVEAGLVAKAQFLDSKLPKPPDALGSIADGYSRYEPSDTQKARFARYAAAADDPVGRITAELRSQQVAKETVETLQALYPEMFRRLQEKITTQLADPTIASRLSYPMRLELSKVMGAPADSTLRPKFIARMQATFKGRDERKPPSGSAPQPEPTQTQRLGGG